MYKTNGIRVEMTAGDYGMPLPFRVKECCAACAQDILSDDVVGLVLSRSGMDLLRRKNAWKDLEMNGGIFSLTLTKEETKLLSPGMYSWRLLLIRDGDMLNTIASGPFFVGVSI